MAFYVFSDQFTELNNQYWGGIPPEILTRRFIDAHGPTANFNSAIADSPNDWKRIAATIEDFASVFDRHRSWNRLLTVIQLTSCFELYLEAVAKASVASDPFLHPGFPKRVDGIMLTKYHYRIPTHNISELTRGTWTQRIKTYKHLFGSAPVELEADKGELEKIRKLRNSIAHQFALDGNEIPIRSTIRRSVSHADLIAWFGVIHKVAVAIDKQLGRDYVGDGETAHLYHLWIQDPADLVRKSGTKLASSDVGTLPGFRKYLNAAILRPDGNDYCRSISKYYNEL